MDFSWIRQITRCVCVKNRIVQAIRKHVIAQDALAGGDEGIGVEEAAYCGIVITALEVIESQLNRIDIALAAYE